MLRVNIKKQLLDIIDIIENIHKKCKLENENIFIVLEECYGAVFSIKINFGHIFKNDLFTLRILDEYLEKVNNILDNQNINLEKLDYLISCIEKLKKAVFEYKAVRQVAFFPYKAEMWDSLESVWKAFQKDTDWECLVVPIPYSKFNKKKQEWIPCYDGANFPKGIPIVDYHIYFVEEEKPDVAFIHNPYDEYNLVTRVDSRYFSHELKKYVNKLVYIPYYLNARTVSDNHLNLSAYKYVDYIMVQSEAFRKRFINTPYYNKVKAFGSPKLDRVIHMNNMQLELLSDWKEILEGKKIVLLNTSLKSFLKDGRLYLEKLHILFQQFNKYKNSVALLWRPHPLFKATIESMRPELLQTYEVIQKEFYDLQIGVLDTNPDITYSVAIADAYIGESRSSVINLFLGIGKPIFILNNLIIDNYRQEEKHLVSIKDMCKVNNQWYILTEYNGIFGMNKDWENIERIHYFENEVNWEELYVKMIYEKQKLYLISLFKVECISYDFLQKNTNKIWNDGESTILDRNMFIFIYKNMICFVLGKKGKLITFDKNGNKIKEFSKGIELLKQSVQKNIFEEIFSAIQVGSCIWMVATYTNKVLCFDMETEQELIYSVGNENMGFSGIAEDGNSFWLTEVRDSSIVKWNKKKNKIVTYAMPTKFQAWYLLEGRRLPHIGICNMGDWIITIPGSSNSMVKLNKKTGEVKLFLPELWKDSEKQRNGYHPQKWQNKSFFKQVDKKRLLVQRNWDCALIDMDIDTEEYKIVIPMLSEKTYSDMIEGQDGFEKGNNIPVFSCRESKIFSVDKFLDNLTNEKLENLKERQLKTINEMTVNTDGTCGEKIYELVKS